MKKQLDYAENLSLKNLIQVNKKTYIVIILSIIGIISLYLWVVFHTPNIKTKDDIILDKLEQLEFKIDSISNIKDSLRIVIDSTHVKIITNEKHYQERINVIINQSSDADSSFITDYIRQHRSKRDSINFY